MNARLSSCLQRRVFALVSAVAISWALPALSPQSVSANDDWTSYCSGARLVHGAVLEAWCYDSNSRVVSNALDLSRYIADNNGLLVVHSQGNFDDACGNGYITADFVLYATCLAVNGTLYNSSLDLKHYVWLDNGRLRFDP